MTLAAWGVFAVAIALLGKTEAPLFDAARARISDFTAPVLSQLRSPVIAFEQWAGSLSTLFSVYRENIALRQENAELRKWQNVALSLENNVRRYELLLNAAPDHDLSSVTARVIGESNRPFIKTMILDAGQGQGVKKGEAVIDDRGLIGRIYLAGEKTSWVILLTDLNSRVPVVIEPSHRRAILSGDTTAAPQLELDVGDSAIKPGDRVLSTGDGGLLPPDVPVGVVTKDGTGWRVALFAKAETSDFVRVLDYGVPPAPSLAAGADALPAASKNSRPSETTPPVVAANPKAPAPNTTNDISANQDEDR